MACSIDLSCPDQLFIWRENKIHVFDYRLKSEIYSYEHKASEIKEANGDILSPNFIQHQFSSSHNILAVIAEDKKLLVWNWAEKSLLKVIDLPKRPTCLCLLHQNENEILVADKYGDVYRCFITEDRKPQLLLGHLSMILDMAISNDDKFVVTGDRDEKIRISFYPNSYSIKSYCLGHTKLITKILFLSPKHLVSCSADSTIRLWSFPSGEELQVFNISSIPGLENGLLNTMLYDGNRNLIVSMEKVAYIAHLYYDGESIHLQKTIKLPQIALSLTFDHKKENIVALSAAEETKVFIVPMDEKNNTSAKDCHVESIFNENQINFGDLKAPTVYSGLVKPDLSKRPTVITPEATINLESSVAKKPKLADVPMEE